MALIAILIAVAAPLVVMAIYIEDWSRDLSQNTAATDPHHADERLRPVEVILTAVEVEEALQTFCEGKSAWTLTEDQPLPADSPLSVVAASEASQTHHLTHTTGLMGFKDDVWVVIDASSTGTRLHAESRSRIGKGDLGQNPRNLRELLRELQASG